MVVVADGCDDTVDPDDRWTVPAAGLPASAIFYFFFILRAEFQNQFRSAPFTTRGRQRTTPWRLVSDGYFRPVAPGEGGLQRIGTQRGETNKKMKDPPPPSVSMAWKSEKNWPPIFQPLPRWRFFLLTSTSLAKNRNKILHDLLTYRLIFFELTRCGCALPYLLDGDSIFFSSGN